MPGGLGNCYAKTLTASHFHGLFQNVMVGSRTSTSVESPPSVFSIDVEDWFHIMDLPDGPRISDWGALPERVEQNFNVLLNVLHEHDVKATFFFLGWVAERHPHLVRAAVAAGHEVASHGYAHDIVYDITPSAFLEDVTRAKHLLESITGKAVSGYRAPGFSATAATPWFFECLVEAGYRYDSSVFPARRQHGGLLGFARAPAPVSTPAGSIYEFPVSVSDVLGQPVCFFGGGYLRLFPYALIRLMARRVLSSGLPVVYYFHPREIDPDHPRLPMSLSRRFKTYVGLRTAKRKVERILSDFSFSTFEQLLNNYQNLGDNIGRA
jgi:polysaccharide deacetylase family protein (PEP-CTERM system associated)